MPHQATAIDIDLLGACHVKSCSAPLYLIESTTNPNKTTDIIAAIAQRAGVPALLIVHDCNDAPLYLAWVWPRSSGHVTGADNVANVLLKMRQQHYTAHHPHCRPRSIFGESA